MIESLLGQLHSFFQRHKDKLLPKCQDEELALLAQIQATYKPIQFYAPDAKKRLEDTDRTLQHYLETLRAVQATSSIASSTEAASDLTSLINKLETKYHKIQRLKQMIPEGILDIKRILFINEPLSTEPKQQEVLNQHLQKMRALMRDCNTNYMHTIEQEGTLSRLFSATTRVYWESIEQFLELNKTLKSILTSSRTLTKAGKLALLCVNEAITSMPADDEDVLLESKELLMAQYSFYEEEAYALCKLLERKKKAFFHIPHNDSFYHIDYDPTTDLAATGGDCFGQSMMFIESLRTGKMKLLCPEMALLNFQLDQQRARHFKKEVLAKAESKVKDTHLVWDDLKDQCTQLQVDALCGLSLCMSPSLVASSSFSAGHICVIARLDEKKTPYKYMIYEKTLGAFGLPDDQALQWVMEHILKSYSGMYYSQAKFTRYAKAGEETYQMLNRIPAISLGTSYLQRPSFFEPAMKLPPSPAALAKQALEGGQSLHIYP